MESKNYFVELEGISIEGLTKPYPVGKNLVYIPWAIAWQQVKRIYPDSTFTTYEDPRTGWNYFTDGKTGWVKVGVTVCGIENIEYRPILNGNTPIPLEKITCADVNKAQKRALVKAVACHGFGISVYGADEMENEAAEAKKPRSRASEAPKEPQQKSADPTKKPTTEGGYRKALTYTNTVLLPGREALVGKTLAELVAEDPRFVTDIIPAYDAKTEEERRLIAAALYIKQYRQEHAA